jgi:hypothetical protein
MRIDALFAILALFLCAMVAYADKPIVIKISESVQYVGKEVEVQGRVVSVITSPLGTTFINFGGIPESEIRRIYCSRFPDSERSAASYDRGKNHQHHGHHPTSRRETGD